MTFNEYINELPAKPSKVKLVILKTLWGEGQKFPKKWVKSSTLLKLTDQELFDRRARELRDELGINMKQRSSKANTLGD